MADQEEDYSSLPLTDRWVHKIWKVRKSAYEDAAKQFELTPDESDPAFRPFLQDPGLWKGAVADSNVAAQQEGIAALCAFLKFGVEKGLSSTRAATKASALEAILLYIELDVSGPIVDDLLPALSNKQPKVIAATLAALTAIFHNYGCKTVDPKPVLKVLPKPFGHADKNVRAEATNLAIEFYRWLREAMKPMFWGDLKPTQQTEMEAQFEKIKSEPAPKQERFLRSQQAAMARAPPPGAEGGDEGEEEAEAEVVEIDAFDLAEPQEVLSKVPANFHEQLASSKWKERKEAVDALYVIINVPRIKDGDYNEIVRGLAKSMKDANIAVVTQAAQCIEVLSKGLRKSFGRYRSVVMGPIMERLKEKKVSVSDALGAALDQVFLSTGLSECLEETLEFLKHKNPQVKEGTMKFLVRCLKTTREAPAKPEVASIAESAKKLLSESSEVLRSGGAEILGTVMKIMGERAMNPYLEGLDDIRKAKIKEFFDTAEVKAKDKPKPPPPVAAPRAAAPASAPKKMVTKKPATKKAPPAPSIYAQVPKAAPPAAGGGLKAPLKRTMPGPGGAAPSANMVSPRRPLSQAPPPVEVEVPPPPRLGLGGRGPAGRSLAKPATQNAPPASVSMSPPPDSGLTALERAELEELRLDKDRLTRQTEELRQERSRLNSEVQELKNQNAQLIEDHTRDVLSIKAKETQLVRARSDCEAAEAMCGQLRREMERLKRALTTAERVNSPPASLTSPSREINGEDIFRDNGIYSGSSDPYRRNSNSRSRMAYTSTLGEEKENSGDLLTGQYGRSKLSPSVERSGRTSAASGSGRASPAREAYRSDRLGSGTGMDGARSEASTQGVESWKRAAEVTSALKAKIELMKAKQARQGISRP
ncbi:hypothetical protein B7463_g10785, partial [Scytalidium lignicola]